jgi:tripartite-type tricarboxylate transporter receptor subunit TctC
VASRPVSLPASTIKDLVTLIKSNSGKYSYASPGTGTPSHLLGEQFRMTLGLDLVHVPFGGSGPAMASVVAGHTPIGFAALSAAAPYAADGKLRALAVMSKTRSQTLPDVSTIAEAGYPGLDGDGWIGVLVPAGTPTWIVTLLNREIVKATMQPDLSERLAAIGLGRVASTPEEFARQMRAESEKWKKVIRAAGLKAE